MTFTYKDLIDETRKAAPALRKTITAAGQAILEVYPRDFAVEYKADESPVTEADLAANKIILAGLSGLPGILGDLPTVSEESEIPAYSRRAQWQAWWLVDPLDGTKEFVRRSGDFTVNIALVHREAPGGPGRPVAGWVAAPVHASLYEGIAGVGASRYDGVAAGRDGAEPPFEYASCRELPLEEAQSPPRIVGSRSHHGPEADAVVDAVSKQVGIGAAVFSGSSLKLCRIAEGSAEFYPRMAPTMEWDTAAADAVCRAAGVKVLEARRPEALAYGKENLLNPWYLASRRQDLLEIGFAALANFTASSQDDR